MNRIFYFIVVVCFFSCKSNSTAQEKEEDTTNTPVIQKPKFKDIGDEDKDPGIVRFIGSIETIDQNTELCNRNYKLVITINIKRINEIGHFIINPPTAGSTVKMGFMNTLIKDVNDFKQKLTIGQGISIRARERTCPDKNKTGFEIITYKMIR